MCLDNAHYPYIMIYKRFERQIICDHPNKKWNDEKTDSMLIYCSNVQVHIFVCQPLLLIVIVDEIDFYLKKMNYNFH